MEETCRFTVNIDELSVQGSLDLEVKVSVLGSEKSTMLSSKPIELVCGRPAGDEFLTISFLLNSVSLTESQISISSLIRDQKIIRCVNILSSSIPDKRFLLRVTYEELLPSATSSSCQNCSALDKIASDPVQYTQLLDQCLLKTPDIPDNSTNAALNIQHLIDNSGPLSSPDAQHLRSALIGMNEKLKVLGLVQQKAEQLQKGLLEQIKINEHLGNLITESTQEFEQKINDREKEIHNLNKEKELINQQLKEANRKLTDWNLQEEKIKQKLNQTELHNKFLEEKLANAERIEKLSKQMKESVAFLEKQRESLKQQLIESTENMTVPVIADSTLSLKEELVSKDKQSKLKDTEIAQLRSSLASSQSEVAYFKAQALSTSIMPAVSKSNPYVSDYEKAIEKMSDINKDLLQKIQELESKNKKLEEILASQNTSSMMMHQEKEALKHKVLALESYKSTSVDTSNLMKSMKMLSSNASTLKDSAYKDLEEVGKYMLDQSAQMLETQKFSNQLRDTIEEKEGENKVLRSSLQELRRKNMFYIPVKDDIIDVAIADYTNTNHPEVPFIRESSGIYFFGTKRVFVKMEHGRVIVRVGGGYMKLEDFVNFYSISEVERYENKLREEANSRRAGLIGQITKAMNNDKTHKRGSNQKYSPFYAISPKISPLKPNKSPRSVRHSFNGSLKNLL